MKVRQHRTTRFLQRHRSLRHVLAVVGGLRLAAAAVCLTVMLLYVGFGDEDIDRALIMKIVRMSQAIFIIGIALGLLNESKGKSRWPVYVLRMFVFAPLIPVLWKFCGGIPNNIVAFMAGRGFLFVCNGVYSLAVVCVGTMQLLAKRTNPSLILSVSFLIFIFVGSFVLMLPRCTSTDVHLHYIDSLFMAASAVTMTGMSSIDAPASLTPLGWTVIVVLMQIGALGVLTFTSFFAIFFSGRTSIYNQLLMRDFIYSKTMGALIPVILYILSFTLVIETVGAIMIYVTMPQELFDTLSEQVFFAGFHSVSAFCNCGFTTLPDGMANPHLLGGTPLFYVAMTVLIFAGGIGFPNLVNLRDVLFEYIKRLRNAIIGRHSERRIHIYDLNTKLVLLFSMIFFIVGALTFYIFEYNNAFEGLPWSRKIVQALFCSATVRTAGFTTFGPSTWAGITFLVALLMMWIGCASQSMGGGIKINTFAVVFLNLRSIISGQKGVAVCNRTISPVSVRRANAVLCLSVFSLAAYAGILMILEPEIPPLKVAFEAFAALTTVGISSGITPELGDFSKIVVASAMFLGRVGILSVLCGLVKPQSDKSSMLPVDDIIIN